MIAVLKWVTVALLMMAKATTTLAVDVLPGIINVLDEVDYYSYVGNEERENSVIALFTAGPSLNCPMCRAADTQLLYILSVLSNDTDLRIVSFDFATSKPLFDKLEIRSVPLLRAYPPQSNGSDFVEYDINRKGVEASKIAKWMQGVVSVKVVIPTPQKTSNVWIFIIILSICCIWLAIVRPEVDLSILREQYGASLKEVLCYICMFIALLFTTGQMWNYIRGAGLMARTQNGLSPIAHGFRNQTQLETAVVMALNTVVAGCFILLVQAPLPSQLQYGSINMRVMVLLGIALVAYGYAGD